MMGLVVLASCLPIHLQIRKKNTFLMEELDGFQLMKET